MGKKKKPDDEEKPDSTGDDSFGLPDIEYKPLEQQQSQAAQETEPVAQETRESSWQSQSSKVQNDPPAYKPSYDEPKSKAPLIIGIIIFLVLSVAGYLGYYYLYKVPAEKERIANEQKAAAEKAAKEAEAQRLAKLKADEEEARRLAEEAELAKPKIGTIETLTARTTRWYVVVSSSIDDDLAMDYAKKLSAKGLSSKIIPPYGKWKFSRLSLADDETFALAQAKADEMKTEYGTGLWVIKY